MVLKAAAKPALRVVMLENASLKKREKERERERTEIKEGKMFQVERTKDPN